MTWLNLLQGHLVVIAAEFDDIIPREIVEQIHSSAEKAENKILHVIPGSRHSSLFPKEEDFLLALELIISACKKKRAT